MVILRHPDRLFVYYLTADFHLGHRPTWRRFGERGELSARELSTHSPSKMPVRW